MAHKDTSRRDAAYGKNQMARFRQMDVVVVGLKGIGIECAKNLCLTGPASVTICDNETVTVADLGANFYLADADVGKKSRADAVKPHLESINPQCTLIVHKGAVDPGFIDKFASKGTGRKALVITDNSFGAEQMTALDDACRAKGVAFFYCGVTGLFASLFSDVGAVHKVDDMSGMTARNMPVKHVCLAATLIEATQKAVDELSGQFVRFIRPSGREGSLETKPQDFKAMAEKLQKLTRHLFHLKKAGLDKRGKTRVAVIADFDVENGETPNHLLWDEDTVRLSGVKGCTAINNEVRKVYFTGGHDKTIFFVDRFEGDTKPYLSGGQITTVNKTGVVKHKPLGEQLGAPSIDDGHVDFAKFGAAYMLHTTRRALWQFQKEKGGLPKLHSDEDAAALCKMADAIGDHNPEWTTKSALYAATETTGMAAFMGGIAAQEVMKVTGYYKPINQWLHFDYLDIVSTNVPVDAKPVGSRYDHQISLFGAAFQKEWASQEIFMVGCGALGCEYLKGIALSGLGCGEGGRVHITDDDVIELSNLSRQFLFREKHVETLKAKSAAEVAGVMNPEFTKAVNVMTERVETKTEDKFTDTFWDGLDFIVNALDNMHARLYVDSKCCLHSKPLFEAGTLSTNCNTAVMLPGVTPHYGAGAMAATQGIPMCTLTQFPYLADHCIEWAKVTFQELYEGGPGSLNKLVASPAGFLKSVDAAGAKEQVQMMRQALQWAEHAKAIKAAGTYSKQIEYLVEVAEKMYTSFFDANIKQLIKAYPQDLGLVGGTPNVDEKGTDLGPFWVGRKKFPSPLTSRTDARFKDFALHTVSIFCDAFSIRDGGKKYPSAKDLDAVLAKVKASDGAGESKGDEGDEGESAAALRKQVEALSLDGLQSCASVDFEKDDPSNHHIEWLAAVANGRAHNYEIPESDPAVVRVKAGNILAAIATATAAITGFQMLELYKHVLNFGGDTRRQVTMNLAVNVLTVESLPDLWPTKDGIEKDAAGNAVPYMVVPEKGHTIWDTILVDAGDLSGPEFAKLMRDQHGGVVITEICAQKFDDPLWSAETDGMSSKAKLGDTFLSLRKSGKKASGRSKEQRSRAGKEMKAIKKAMGGALSFITEASTGEDKYEFNLKMKGPEGSPYEGGTFLVTIKLPKEWPNVAPKVGMKPEPYHCNFKDGEPCANLLFGSWGPAMRVEGVVASLHQLLTRQEAGTALRPALAEQYTSNKEAFIAEAKKRTAAEATSDLEFPKQAAPEESKEEAAMKPWPHDYVLLECEAVHPDYFPAPQMASRDTKMKSNSLTPIRVKLPRIKFVFRNGEMLSLKGGPIAVYKPPRCEPLDKETEAKVMALELELDDEPCKILSCYKLQADRAKVYSQLEDVGSSPIAVTCECDGNTVELILKGEDFSSVTMEDAITMCVISVSSIVQAQFGPDGPWTLAAGDVDSLENEKMVAFKIYADMAGELPPDCMASFRRLLQAGPVNKLFAQGATRTLRMPANEEVNWQTVTEKNGRKKTTLIPRPAHAVRVWDAKTRCYKAIDTFLGGAPRTAAELDTWYKDLCFKLKFSSRGLGSDFVDGMATSTRHNVYADVSKGVCGVEPADPGTFKNKWTDLCQSVTESYKPSGGK